MDNNGDGGAAGGESGAGGGSAADIFGGGASQEQAAGAGGDAGGGAGAGDGGENGGGEGGGQGGGAGAEFLASLSADAAGEEKSNRDWVAAKGFKDLDALVGSMRHAEKALHDSGRIKVPGEGASEQELRAFHTAIGVPDDAKGYVVAPPKDGAGNEIPLDQTTIGKLAETALASGMPKGAFEATVQAFAKLQMDDIAATEREARSQADAIAKSWGEARSDNMAALDRAVSALDLDAKQIAAMRNIMGPQQFIEKMLFLGKGISESKVFGSDTRTSFGISEAEAQAKMDAAKKEPGFMAKAQTAGTVENRDWNTWQTILGEAANRKARETA